MDQYLSIAEEVLRAARQPLSPRDILKRAYAEGWVPAHLFGKTQHKTLQARLSEDILLLRERSCFFRTEPGRFFLREFLSDENLPTNYRTPIVARRRKRELAQRNALALQWKVLGRLCKASNIISPNTVLELLRNNKFHYARSSKDRDRSDVVIWSFVLVVKEHFILTYRHGRYREDRDSFFQRRSVGFFSPVIDDDLSLFEQSDHGIVSSGLRGMSIDLDLPSEALGGEKSSARLECFICADSNPIARDLLAIVKFDSPDWFEPIIRRLAINDLKWQDLRTPVNHIDDFDPWSRLILEQTQLTARLTKAVNEAKA